MKNPDMNNNDTHESSSPSSVTRDTGIFDNPRNVNIVLGCFYVGCIVLAALDFVIHRHIYLSFEKVPAFYAIYGFVACVVLVILAKGLRKILMRDEDYYEPMPAATYAASTDSASADPTGNRGNDT